MSFPSSPVQLHPIRGSRFPCFPPLCTTLTFIQHFVVEFVQSTIDFHLPILHTVLYQHHVSGWKVFCQIVTNFFPRSSGLPRPDIKLAANILRILPPALFSFLASQDSLKVQVNLTGVALANEDFSELTLACEDTY